MTDDTVTSVDNGDNLEAFEADFFGTTATQVVEKPEAEAEDVNEEADLGEDNDPPAPDEDDDLDEEPAPKKNKVPARERIEQLNTQLREQERERIRERVEFEKRIEMLETAVKEKAKEEQVPLKEVLPDAAPNPEAVNDKGEPLYPLGEYDPKYIADLTEFTVSERLKEVDAQRKREAELQQIAAAQEQLRTNWVDRLDAYEQEAPDVRENIRELTDTFADIHPGYGEYLAATLMASEYGPQVMHYLSQNIGEAQKIVASGPAAATLALGRLEAMFAKSPNSATPKEKKLSKAPAPPEDRARGRNGQFSVRPDTDNLDAFEKEFFS